ncbi:helix-turn-helix domain-containing protein [Rhodococcus sp. ARC_M12]|uniref:helix-turn-helix domain-containing protein n=1 Tax=Rhodococcus sp. ARC_M12 TaxID=2928854 RepID=UPI0035ADDAAE
MPSPDDDEIRFAQRMQELRERLGISQSSLVARLREDGWPKVHQTTISRIEKGERPVRLGEARAIAAALRVPLSRLVEPEPAAIVSAELSRHSASIYNAFFELTEQAHEVLRLQEQLRAALTRFHEGSYRVGHAPGQPMSTSFTREALGPSDPLTLTLEDAIADARAGFELNPSSQAKIRFEMAEDQPSAVTFSDGPERFEG